MGAFYIICFLTIGVLQTIGELAGGASFSNTREVAFQWLSLAGVLLATWVVLRKVEKLPWSAVGLDRAAFNPPALLTGAALGLALATKGTSYVYAAGFGVVFVIVAISGLGTRVLPRLAVAGVCALALNGGYFARNVDLFGAPLGPGIDDINGFVRSIGQIVSLGRLINEADVEGIHRPRSAV